MLDDWLPSLAHADLDSFMNAVQSGGVRGLDMNAAGFTNNLSPRVEGKVTNALIRYVVTL